MRKFKGCALIKQIEYNFGFPHFQGLINPRLKIFVDFYSEQKCYQVSEVIRNVQYKLFLAVRGLPCRNWTYTKYKKDHFVGICRVKLCYDQLLQK